MAAALVHYGYRMELKESYMHLPRKERPSLWGSWMQRQRNPWMHYVLALHVGKQGHWVVIKGVKVCDTHTDGAWAFVCDWPHRGSASWRFTRCAARWMCERVSLSARLAGRAAHSNGAGRGPG